MEKDCRTDFSLSLYWCPTLRKEKDETKRKETLSWWRREEEKKRRREEEKKRRREEEKKRRREEEKKRRREEEKKRQVDVVRRREREKRRDKKRWEETKREENKRQRQSAGRKRPMINSLFMTSAREWQNETYDTQSLRESGKTRPTARGGGLGSRPKKMYGERLGDGVEYHLMKPTPRR